MLVNGRAVRSCIAPAQSVAGQDVVTIEGLGSPERPDPLQAAFIAEQAAQCGYCTAGMVMSARALLGPDAAPERDAGARGAAPATSAAAAATRG